MPKFNVQVARLERKVQTVVVEATSEIYLKDHLSDIYDEVTIARYDMWEVSPDHLVLEGTHTILSEVTTDYEINAEDVEADIIFECYHDNTILDNDRKRFCLECYETL